MHQYTVEKIYNFTCSKCKNWWSYATGHPTLPLYMQQNFTCPHCGHEDATGENADIRRNAIEDWVKQGRTPPGNPGLA
tara:strand:- start:140 stop:373 length:234 start_codon:yes stop_codon:yes gene_type:complete